MAVTRQAALHAAFHWYSTGTPSPRSLESERVEKKRGSHGPGSGWLALEATAAMCSICDGPLSEYELRTMLLLLKWVGVGTSVHTSVDKVTIVDRKRPPRASLCQPSP